MITIQGNQIIADTKTQTVVFTNGRLTAVKSKLDGRHYQSDTDSSEIPISLVYACNQTLPMGKTENCSMETTVYSDCMVNISFTAWNGHAELLIEENPKPALSASPLPPTLPVPVYWPAGGK